MGNKGLSGLLRLRGDATTVFSRLRAEGWAWRWPDEHSLNSAVGTGSGAKRPGHEPPPPGHARDAILGDVAFDPRARRLRRRVRSVVSAPDRIEFALVVSPRARRTGRNERVRAPGGNTQQRRRRNSAPVIAPRLILVVTANGTVTLCRASAFGGAVRVLHRFESTEVIGACGMSAGGSSIAINDVSYLVDRIWTRELFRLQTRTAAPQP